MVTPRDWDGVRYDRLSDPQVRMALPVLDRLALRGDETVLDAGCGSGRVTELLLERVPRGRVIAVDASQSMIEQARQRLERHGDRVRLVGADLQQPLPVGELVEGGDAGGGRLDAGNDGFVDAVLSTATFHWIKDHDALFRNLAALMRPGAQLVFQCGGEGNIASVVAALREMGETWEGPWNFAGPEETRERLERAGFEEINCWLTREPVALEPGEAAETYLATVVLGAHVDRLTESERQAYVREVAARLPNPERPVLDYVRLNAAARRA